jgi:hypothetical protein
MDHDALVKAINRGEVKADMSSEDGG